MARKHNDRGQASVEFVAILPLALLAGAFIWQMVIVGRTVSIARDNARAAARAHAIGTDPTKAARTGLSGNQAKRTTVRTRGDRVTVKVPVPTVIGLNALPKAEASARMRSQSGDPE